MDLGANLHGRILDIEPETKLLLPLGQCLQQQRILHWNCIPVFADIDKNNCINTEVKNFKKNQGNFCTYIWQTIGCEIFKKNRKRIKY